MGRTTIALRKALLRKALLRNTPILYVSATVGSELESVSRSWVLNRCSVLMSNMHIYQKLPCGCIHSRILRSPIHHNCKPLTFCIDHSLPVSSVCRRQERHRAKLSIWLGQVLHGSGSISARSSGEVGYFNIRYSATASLCVSSSSTIRRKVCQRPFLSI